MRIDFGAYVGARVRLQRMADCALFEGWVTNISPDRVIVRMLAEKGVIGSQAFFAEIIGRETTVQLNLTFTGTEDVDVLSSIQLISAATGSYSIMEAQELEYEFAIDRVLKVIPSKEPYRRRVEDFAASIQYAGMESEVEVVDVSDGGVGVMLDCELPIGTEVTLVLNTRVGFVNLNGVVMRSNRPRIDAQAYLTGIATKPATRIDQAKWNQFMVSAAA